jgi:hypothetical protein
VDYVTGGEGWDWWNFKWPWLGDISLAFTYEPIHKWYGDEFGLTDRKKKLYMSSLAIESIPKFATGNDNLRRGTTPRNMIFSGQTDWYNGIAFKQQAWRFSFVVKAGYNWRLAAVTKYAPGLIDMADQVKVFGEVMFQIPSFPVLSPPKWKSGIWQSFAIGAGLRYAVRIGESTLDPIRGEFEKLGDDGGYLMELTPKVVYQVTGTTDITFDMSVPLGGKKSFLGLTNSFYLPPYEIESYDAVGITYSLGVQTRFQ